MTISQATASSSPKRHGPHYDTNSSFKDDPLLLVDDRGLSSSSSLLSIAKQQHHPFHHGSAAADNQPTVLDTKDESSPPPSVQANGITMAKQQQHDDNENERHQQQASIQDKDNSIVLPASRHATDTTMTAPYNTQINPSPCSPQLTTTTTWKNTALLQEDDDEDEEEQEATRLVSPIQKTTRDVFTEAQKVAFVGLCAVTSLEIVHSFHGNEYAYARMSADNWQRKLMRDIYKHMDVSSTEIGMIEDLFKHGIQAADLVLQFMAQGETTTVQVHQLDDDDDDSTFTNDDGSSSSSTTSLSFFTPPLSPSTSSSAAATTTTPSMDDDDDPTTTPTTHDTVELDLRWTVMCSLLLLFLNAENFDARTRVFLSRTASYLQLDWRETLMMEQWISDQFIGQQQQCCEDDDDDDKPVTMTTTTTANDFFALPVANVKEKRYRNRERRMHRYAMIGLATVGGGLILGVSAGLMSPLIAGGIGTLLSTVGVSGAGSFFGSTAGIAMITGSMTSIGGGLGAKSMKRRMKTINTFEFQPVATNGHPSCIITVSGWLPKKCDRNSAAALPFSTLDPLLGDHYALHWEPEMLQDLGSAFKIFATEVVAFSIQQALTHTIMGALLAGLAWPLALTKLGYLVDNPWHNGLDRARLAGLILADSLMNRNLGARPVTLVGYSLGARVIFYCLLELARVNAHGLVDNVALFGTPVSASQSQWEACISVVAGRFVNGYSKNDWLLGFLFRASTAGLNNVAGLRPLKSTAAAQKDKERVLNIDCTDILKGHLSYRTCMPKLLKRAGFLVTSEELPDRVKASEEEENNSDHVVLDLSGAKELEHFKPSTKTNRHSFVSSLSSGRASIQYPPPKTQCTPHPLSLQKRPNSIIASTTPSLSFGQSSPSLDDVDPTTPAFDADTILADIMAEAALASKSPGKYSSLSMGRASISLESSSTTQDNNDDDYHRRHSWPVSLNNTNSVVLSPRSK